MKYFLIFLSSLIWISGCSLNQPPKKAFIETMMKSDKCTNACWLGIEAGMTIEREKVYGILSDYYGSEKVHYTDDGSLDVIWRINPSVAFSEGGYIKLNEKSQVDFISITPRSNQITVDDLVTAFGIPEITIVKNPNETQSTTPCGLVRLLYPTIGLSVYIESGTEIKYVNMMDIRKPFPASEVQLRKPLDLIVNWDERDKYCTHTTSASP